MTELEYSYNDGADIAYLVYTMGYMEVGGLGLYGSSHTNHCLEVLTKSTDTTDIDYSITMPASVYNFVQDREN